MNRDDYIQLIYKFLKGESTPKEKGTLENWLDKDEKNRTLKKDIEQSWRQSENYHPNLDIDVKADFDLLKQRIRKEKNKSNPNPKIRSMNPRRRWLAIAAAIALAITAGWWWSNNGTIEQNMLIAETGSNEKRSIILADGSQVWLNENSRLTFPTLFSSEQRTVKLEGEAFFEVEKNTESPFIISMSAANVTVLGTSFNINARAENPEVTVSVRTGKVRLQSKQSKQALELTKDEKAWLNTRTQELNKNKNPNTNDFAWQTGVLRFKGQTLEEAVQIISKHYKGEVVIVEQTMKKCPFVGRLQEENLKDALNYIADVFQMTLIQKSANSFELSNGLCQ